jgi:3-hydroxymyristoyl/3-hydroxydecanoyl-(acyl carrier protein) dehydratase
VKNEILSKQTIINNSKYNLIFIHGWGVTYKTMLYFASMWENKYSTYFVKIDKIVFHRKVVPGDTLVFRVEQVAPLRHSLSVMKGYVFVGETLVAEAVFTGQITKNKE